ncbi:hypothetical protein KP77_06400 [Jeotgalibacillus alimentarius]|uniref:Uncharacterized protein n=2 Tax=Jeotgalibacillus TaxID=157226 RepID=A0A0C2RQ27_9BACL|nr:MULTISPECIES: hypothetical protein [Jeotgalibacillus]KIL52380.1 hypothetical protein KP77_06400 [Jeotgalibacillus alimentarius]MBM7579496.1 hypothetical protein [Jeotgalibacillus terrae]
MRKESSFNKDHVLSLIDSIDRLTAARKRDRAALLASLDELEEKLAMCDARIRNIKDA